MRRFSTEFDYYKVLEIERTAESVDIKKAFRTLSKTHHPDKGGDEEHFKKMQESYVVLMDTNTRHHYDSYLKHYENVDKGSDVNFPDWYEPNPHFQSQADGDPDLEELNLWPDARYFQDIIDGDPDRPKTLGWHKREERRQQERESTSSGKTYSADDMMKKSRKEREEIEEEDRKKREKEYEEETLRQEKEKLEKLEQNLEAEMVRRKMEAEILAKKKKEGKSVFSDFTERYNKMVEDQED
jgi:curved DNA-binding protein CbpA